MAIILDSEPRVMRDDKNILHVSIAVNGRLYSAQQNVKKAGFKQLILAELKKKVLAEATEVAEGKIMKTEYTKTKLEAALNA